MTSRNARIAMELIRIARSLSLKGVLEYGIIMGGMLQSVVDVLVGDRHVVQVDLDVLLDGVDSHGREYKSRDDSTVLKGVSSSYRKGQDITDYLYHEFKPNSFFCDCDLVDEIKPVRIRFKLKDGTEKSVGIVNLTPR